MNYYCTESTDCIDAKTEGFGAVLFQKTDEGYQQPIAFMSKKLNKTQKNYSVTELECLAAILAVKKFHPYVEGHEFTLITNVEASSPSRV